jgi:Flp pilus assembly protein TadG
VGALSLIFRKPADQKTARRRQRGQNLVEFALVAPLFLLLVMAIVDFGWLFKTYITTTNCAREGARIGIVGATEATIEARATDPSKGCPSDSTATATGAQGPPGADLKVEVKHTYTFITPIGSLLTLVSGGTLPDHIDLSASTTMRME